MGFYIDINNTNYDNFIQILESLKAMGVINNYLPTKKNEHVLPGKELSDEDIIQIVEESEQDFKAGNFLSHEEVKKRFNQWRQERK